MIDVDGIRQILKQSNIYGSESSKNFICKCIYCGDKGKNHHFHGYLSKVDNVPCYHCFYCNKSTSVSKFLFDLTGDEHKDLVVPVNNKNYVKKSTVKKVEYKVPEINSLDFPAKSLYMRRRTFGKLDVTTEIPNLIFDIKEFFNINNLDPFKYLEGWQLEYIQNTMIAFLSKRHTILYCRAVVNDVPTKFKKIELQKDDVYPGLDYYCIDNYIQKSNMVVLSEGNFDILGCYSLDTLGLRDKCRAYCAGCTFSYDQLLRSVCLDFGLYNPDVIVLSDSDKQKCHYMKFLNSAKDFTNKIEIYYNSCAKDFGDYPHKAVKLF